MLQAGLHFDLAQEAVGQFRLIGQIRKQHLHGFDAVGNDVADLVDLAHSAGAQNADDLVIADGRTDFEIHRAPTSCWKRCRRL